MKPDYKNWFPNGLVFLFFAGFALCLVGFLLAWFSGMADRGPFGMILAALTAMATAFMAGLSFWGYRMNRAFAYGGKRQMSKGIVEGVADHVRIPNGGTGLDVGCGSGALAIACAKRNPTANIVGIDRWGREYASYSKSLCEENAKAEGTGNVRFQQGNAVKLAFADESFDAVMSNYVYHNVMGVDRQALLLETLRVLKKDGTFAIHDIFSKAKYGDMKAFVLKLKEMGYAEVELIDTTDGLFMSRAEARWMLLGGSALLVGRK